MAEPRRSNPYYPPPYPLHPPAPHHVDQPRPGDGGDSFAHSRGPPPYEAHTLTSYGTLGEPVEDQSVSEPSFVYHKTDEQLEHDQDTDFDRFTVPTMSYPPPQPETYAYHQSFDNASIHGANLFQTINQNYYLGGLPNPALPQIGLPNLQLPYNINSNARVVVNNGHHNNISTAAASHGLAIGYGPEQSHVQSASFEQPFISNYRAQAFGEGTLHPQPSNDTQTTGSTSAYANQLALTQGAPEPAQFAPFTRSRAPALAFVAGDPLFTNLPRVRTVQIPRTLFNVPPPAQRMPKTSGFHTRASNPNDTYGNQLDLSPPENVQPPLNCDISIMEINIFFPRWYLLPDVAMRAVVNGWGRKEIAKAHLHAINRLDKSELKKAEARLQKCFSTGGKILFQIPEAEEVPGVKQISWSQDIVIQSNFPKDNLTAINWRLRTDYKSNVGEAKQQFGHVALSDIWPSVPFENWPKGADRMTLTRCLEFARDYPELDLDTSHFDWIMFVMDFGQQEFQDSRADTDALRRFKLAVPDPKS